MAHKPEQDLCQVQELSISVTRGNGDKLDGVIDKKMMLYLVYCIQHPEGTVVLE